MTASKSAIAALVIVAGLTVPARAQKPAVGVASGDYSPSQTAAGLSNYYAMPPNFANYGLSGTYPDYGGYGYTGFGPGPQFGAHYASTTRPKPDQTTKKPAAPTLVRKNPIGPMTGPSQGKARPRKGL